MALMCVIACGPSEATTAIAESSTGSEVVNGQAPHAHMTLDRIDAALHTFGQNVVRRETAWSFEYLDTPLLIVAAPKANRMRVVAQVRRVQDVLPAQWANMMVANFHSALDARYAVSGEWLYSIYLHPLENLHESDLRSAVSQVVTLAKSFGTTYNSTGVVFGGSSPAPP